MCISRVTTNCNFAFVGRATIHRRIGTVKKIEIAVSRSEATDTVVAAVVDTMTNIPFLDHDGRMNLILRLVLHIISETVSFNLLLESFNSD